MNSKTRKPAVALLIAFSLTLPAYSESLSSLLTAAQKNSEAISTLEVNRQQSLLTIEMNDIGRQTSYTINPSLKSSYSNTTNANAYNFVGESGNLVSITIPGVRESSDPNAMLDDTHLYLNSDFVVINDHEDNSFYYGINPSIVLDHTFLFGQYNTKESDITKQINILTVNQSYESGVLNYKKTALGYIRSIISNTKDQESVQNSIDDMETTIQNKLDLEMYTKDTVAYKSDLISLTNLKNSLINLKAQKESLLTRFKDYAGTDYVDIDDIELPELEIKTSNEDSLSVQLAKLKLQLAQNNIDEVNNEANRSSLTVNGGIATNQNSYSYDTTYTTYTEKYNSDYTGSVGASYLADNVGLSGYASIKSTYDGSTWSYVPSLTISGKWSNDTTKRQDVIINKKNSNALIVAQSELNTTISDDTYNRIKVQSDADSWKFKYSQIKDSLEISKEQVELDKQMLELGLKSQSELDTTVFNYEQLKYDELTCLIDGWLVSLDIESLNL